MSYEFIAYNGLKSTVKDGEVIDISVNGYDNPLGEASFLIKIKRSDPDEKSIERGVRDLFKERLSNPSMFDDAEKIRKEMKDETQRRIDQAWAEWQHLPQATIFEVFMRKIQRSKGKTNIVAGVSLAASSYFIEHKMKLDQMMFDFEKIPYFTFHNDKSKYIMKQVDEFYEEFTVEEGPELQRQEPLKIEGEFEEYGGRKGVVGDIVGDLKRVDDKVKKSKK